MNLDVPNVPKTKLDDQSLTVDRMTNVRVVHDLTKLMVDSKKFDLRTSKLLQDNLLSNDRRVLNTSMALSVLFYYGPLRHLSSMEAVEQQNMKSTHDPNTAFAFIRIPTLKNGNCSLDALRLSFDVGTFFEDRPHRLDTFEPISQEIEELLEVDSFTFRSAMSAYAKHHQKDLIKVSVVDVKEFNSFIKSLSTNGCHMGKKCRMNYFASIV